MKSASDINDSSQSSHDSLRSRILQDDSVQNQYGSFPSSKDIDKSKPINVYKIQTKKERSIKPILMVESVVVLYVMGKVLTMSSSSQFIQHRFIHEDDNSTFVKQNLSFCIENSSDPVYIWSTQIQQKTSLMSLYLSVAQGIPTTISSIILGANCDYIGRNILLLLPTIGIFIQSLTFALVCYFRISLNILIVGQVLSGLTGEVVTFLLAAFSITCNLCTGQTRTFHITVLEVLFVGFHGISFVSVGYMLTFLGYYTTFFIACGISLLNALIISTFVRDSKLDRKKLNKNMINLKCLLYRVFKFYITNKTGSRLVFNLCLILLVLRFYTVFSIINVLVTYLLGRPLCWDSIKIGQYNALYFSIPCICSALFVKLSQRWLTDLKIAFVTFISLSLQLLFMGLARTASYNYIAIACGVIGVSTAGLLRSFMSKLVEPDENGAMFASIASVESITTMVSGILGNVIYANSVEYFSGLVFIIGAAVSGLAAVVTLALEVIVTHQRLYDVIS